MGLLLGISKDAIANFTVAAISGGGYVYDTYLNVLGADTWDCNIDFKRMQQWQLEKKLKLRVKITNTERISYSDRVGGSYFVGAEEVITSPPAPRYPGDTGGAATINQTPVTTRDDLVDYERVTVNFKSLCAEVVRSKADVGFTRMDYSAQAASATIYSQTLYLFEDATGCTGLYFGPPHPTRPHDFRSRNLGGLDAFAVLVDTGDVNAPTRFVWTQSTTRTYNIPVTIHTNWIWGTGAVGDPTDPLNSVATASRILGFHTLLLTITEELLPP